MAGRLIAPHSQTIDSKAKIERLNAAQTGSISGRISIRSKLRPNLNWIAPGFALCLLVLWQLLVPASGPTTLLLPQPSAIVVRFIQVSRDGSLLSNVLITTSEVVLGFTFGVSSAFIMGYSIARSRTLERVAGPYVVAFQALPIVAIAPALILWLGPGLISNSILCAFIVFFPMLVSTAVGVKSIAPEHRALMQSLAANRWQTFRLLELPAALPSLFGGIKVSVTLAVAGAVVAEAVTPLGGLGSMLYAARSRYDSPLAFVAVFSLIVFTLLLYSAVRLLERRLLVRNSFILAP